MSDEPDVPSIVVGLRELAGRPAAGSPFVVNVEGVPIRVEYTTGTTPTIWLSTPYPSGAHEPRAGSVYRAAAASRFEAARPMKITLRREDADDRESKEAGTSVEVQTGDVDFDREVYVDSPSDAIVVTRVLESPELRNAAMKLLSDGFKEIVIDDDDGVITTTRGVSVLEKLDARHVAAAFAAIAREVPVVQKTGARRDLQWMLLAAAMMVACVSPLLVIFALVIVGKLGSSDPRYAPLLIGGGLGLVAGAALGAVAKRFVRGRSDSRDRVVAAVFGLSGVGMTVGVLVGMGFAMGLWVALALPMALAVGIAWLWWTGK